LSGAAADTSGAGSSDAGSLTGRDIVCVGFAEWDAPLWTNQQHLMSRLAAHNRVLFIESLGLRRPQVAGADLSRMARRLVRGLRGPRSRDGLHVLSPLVIPLHSSAAVRALNGRLLPRLVSRAARRLDMRRPILWAYVPQAEVLADALDPALLVYHCVDDIASQKGVDAPSFRAAEERFARRADLVIASSRPLARRMRELNGNVLEAPNVADTALFATALEPGPVDPAIAVLPEPRIVFTGAVTATKLDLGLIEAIARARPDWSIALVGPVGAGDPSTDVSGLASVGNVHLLGPRTYEELPAVLRGAAAGLIPYARNDLTTGIFPMKVYEYLAAGLPVISTELPSLEGVEEVTVVTGADEAVAAIERAMAADDPESRARRSRAAAGHSWDERIAEIGRALAAVER
jgi:glycosyltransferase involved in cell wall biosynthesis